MKLVNLVTKAGAGAGEGVKVQGSSSYRKVFNKKKTHRKRVNGQVSEEIQNWMCHLKIPATELIIY